MLVGSTEVFNAKFDGMSEGMFDVMFDTMFADVLGTSIVKKTSLRPHGTLT